MSRYAWLVCVETKQMVWLGKIVATPVGESYFHIGGQDAKPNSESIAFSKAIMKFLAQHIGKSIQVVPEESLVSVVDDTFVEIGDDTGITTSDYIRDFLG